MCRSGGGGSAFKRFPETGAACDTAARMRLFIEMRLFPLGGGE